MENASKALLIAGAILLAILIIAIGMFIYNSAQSTITSSMSSMTTQETDAFNNQFTAYENAQTGSNVKALIGRLIANADTYKEETGKIPTVTVEGTTPGSLTAEGKTSGKDLADATQPQNQGAINEYVTQLGVMRNAIEAKHTYWVECRYGTTGIINEIALSYACDQLNEIGR